MYQLLRNLVFAFILAALLWLGYSLFIKTDAPADTVATGDVQALVQGQIFFSELQQLRQIDFDSSIFRDPRFQSLVDQSKEIIDEPYGRANPFSPVR